MSDDPGYNNSQNPPTPYSGVNSSPWGVSYLLKSVSPERAKYNRAISALTDFKDKMHPPIPVNIKPSTGHGHLICQYEPFPQVLTVYVKCGFDFRSEPGKKITAEELQKAEEEKRAPVMLDDPDNWDPEAIKTWKENFFTQSLNWSGRFMFYCGKDWWENLTAFVIVKFSEAGPTESYDLKVIVHKDYAVKATNVRLYGSIMELNPFDNNIVLVHELGHVLGLGDEYVPKDEPSTAGQPAAHSLLVEKEFGYPILRGRWKKESIMTVGPDIQIEHGVTFLEALRQVTNIDEWTFTKKSPRPIPA